MQHVETRFVAPDQLSLFSQSWQPDAPPRARIVFVHGFTDHGSRHRRLASELTEQGYAVDSFDLRGHGRSNGARTWVERFDQYIEDLDVFFDRVEEQAEGTPVFVMGFSMGGTIAARWVIQRQRKVAGAILIAPAVGVGRRVFPALRRAARFGSAVVPRLRLVRMGCSCISRDKMVVEAFRTDRLVCHGRFPIRTGAEILRAGEDLLTNAKQLRLPLLILQGSCDYVVCPGATQRLFSRAASADKSLKYYFGLFHELHSEPERNEVINDILTWLDERSDELNAQQPAFGLEGLLAGKAD